MEARTLSETLASGPRMEILNLVATVPASISRIAEALDISPTAARFHLQRLLDSGLVTKVEERGSVGRPRILYRATGKRVEIGFPMRNYMRLSEVLIHALLANPDQKQVEESLREVGREHASYIAKDLISKAPGTKWDAEAFKKHVVEGTLKEWGTQPEIMAASRDRLQYRYYNCPFKELAQKYPRMICEVLDDALHREMCKELNPKIDLQRLKCAGHGDAYCEYLLSWRPP